MAKRITDLEKFALEHVWRPYRDRMGFDARLEVMPRNLEDTAKLLITDESGWSDLVLDRITAIKFYFPNYIVHPLVDVIKAAQASRSKLSRERD